MTADGPVERENSARVERRRAHRHSLIIPVEVEWDGPDGVRARGQGRAKNVNAHGALLHMKNSPHLNAEVSLKNSLSGEATQARPCTFKSLLLQEWRGVSLVRNGSRFTRELPSTTP